MNSILVFILLNIIIVGRGENYEKREVRSSTEASTEPDTEEYLCDPLHDQMENFMKKHFGSMIHEKLMEIEDDLRTGFRKAIYLEVVDEVKRKSELLDNSFQVYKNIIICMAIFIILSTFFSLVSLIVYCRIDKFRRHLYSRP